MSQDIVLYVFIIFSAGFFLSDFLAKRKKKETTWVNVKKVHSDAVIPKYAKAGDSGFDLHLVEDVTLAPNETKLARTGLSMEVPEGLELQVRPRSGQSLKTALRVANSPGTVDSGFRGEICVIAWNSSPTETLVLKKGDKIAQGVVCPILNVRFLEIEELTATERGSGGFGSTN